MKVRLKVDYTTIDPSYIKGKVIDCNAAEGARLIKTGKAEALTVRTSSKA